MNTQTNSNQLAEVENKEFRDLHYALSRLRENPDFQLLITEGYFKNRAVESVSLLANEGVVRGGHRPAIMEVLVAISHLQDYFIMIDNLGAEPVDEDDDNPNEVFGSNDSYTV